MHDVRKATLATLGFSGDVNDTYYRYMLSESHLPSNGKWAIEDLEKAALANYGYTTGSLNDRWSVFLTNMGYTGTLNDKFKKFWTSGSGMSSLALDNLTHTVIPRIGAVTPTFTRATTKRIVDSWGRQVTCLAGEVAFPGARRVRNLVATTSENFSDAAWTKVAGGTGTAPTITSGQTDPDGGTTAYRLQATVSAGTTAADYSLLRQTFGSLPSGNPTRMSVWIKSNTGATQTVVCDYNGNQTLTVTTSWQRLSSLNQTGGIAFDLGCKGSVAGADKTVDVLIWKAQVEDVTGQSVQTAGEYVSVGVPGNWFGTDLISNGTFSTDTTGWTVVNASLSVVSGAMRVTNVGANTGYAYQAITTAVGTKYVVTSSIALGSSAAFGVYVGTAPGAGNIGGGSGSSSNVYRYEFTATGTTTYISLINLQSVDARYTDFDNVVCKPAPYHGSCVDGVKCFPTDLSGNPLPTAATFNAVSLNGIAGTYVSTPDSVANSITGDIDIRANVLLADWTPSANQYVIGKDNGAAQRSWLMWVDTSGFVNWFYSNNGTAARVATSSSATGFTDGTQHWIRATYASATGKVNFYTSSDGTTWSSLGAEQTVTAGAIFDSTSGIGIGADSVGTSGNITGRIYQAQIYNGINGTLAVDFNASRYSGGGTTLTGSTGETWTLNGSAIIHPTNIPMTTPLIELAATNICLQSNAFTTTWVKDATLTLVQNAVGPDGATSAWTLTDASAVGGSYITQDITLTAASYTMSFFVKKTTGAQANYPIVLFYLAATTGLAGVTVDTSNGVATAWTAYTGFTGITGSATCVSYNSTYWRVSLTFTGTAAAWTLRMYPAGTTNPTQSTGTLDLTAQGSAVFYGAQVELGSAATSYIPTTTVAAARNADQLYYTGALIASLKSIAVRGYKRDVGVSNFGVMVASSDGTANNYAELYMLNATALSFAGGASGVAQWNQAASNAYTPGQLSNAAWSAATNDIKMAKDGVAQTADTSATVPAVSRLEYGMVAGVSQLNGYPGKVYGWTTNVTQAGLNTMTT